jgi:hypothetical protein
MKRSVGTILMMLGLLTLHRLGPVREAYRTGSGAIDRSVRSTPQVCKGMTAVSADDSGSDDSGDSDDSDSGDSQ